MIAAVVSILALLALFGLLAVAAVVVAFALSSGFRSRVATSAPASGPATEDGPPRTLGWQRDLVVSTLDGLYERRARKALLEDVTEAAADEQKQPVPRKTATRATPKKATTSRTAAKK